MKVELVVEMCIDVVKQCSVFIFRGCRTNSSLHFSWQEVYDLLLPHTTIAAAVAASVQIDEIHLVIQNCDSTRCLVEIHKSSAAPPSLVHEEAQCYT